MKKFEFPMNIPSIFIYVGKEEWPLYKQHSETDEEGVPSKGEGRSTNNVMWVEELEWSILWHEHQHVMDFIYFVKDIPTELEYRADIAGMVNTAVVQWVLEMNNNAKEA